MILVIQNLMNLLWRSTLNILIQDFKFMKKLLYHGKEKIHNEIELIIY